MRCDVATEEVKDVDVSAIATGDNKFFGICAVDGTVVLAPHYAQQLLAYDVAPHVRTVIVVDRVGDYDSPMLICVFVDGTELARCPLNLKLDVATLRMDLARKSQMQPKNLALVLGDRGLQLTEEYDCILISHLV